MTQDARSAAKPRTKASTNAPESSRSPTTRRRGKSQSASTADSTTYQVTDYEWLPVGKFQTHVCCDCGLSHKIQYRIHDGSMQEQWTRDERETKKQRTKK